MYFKKLNILRALRFSWPDDSKLARNVARLIAYPILLLVILLIVSVIVALFSALLGLNEYEGKETQSAAIRNIGLFLGAIIGVPFVVWRSIVAQRQVNVAEQGHITERINKAVEGLGAEKTVKRQRTKKNGKLAYAKGENGDPDFSMPLMEEITQPNLEVRIGAIYGLERIAQDSDRDHVQIMEILCAYIRENAPISTALKWPKFENDEQQLSLHSDKDWTDLKHNYKAKCESQKALAETRTDIQVALTVIGRRSQHQRVLEATKFGGLRECSFVFDTGFPNLAPNPDKGFFTEENVNAIQSLVKRWKKNLSDYDGYRLDIRSTNLQGMDLSDLNFNGARFDNSALQGANLRNTKLNGAVFRDSDLTFTKLKGATLQGAFLAKANLQLADLREADLQCSYFRESQLQAANLSGVKSQNSVFALANLCRSNLKESKFHFANFQKSNLEHADIQLACCQMAKFNDANMKNSKLQNTKCYRATFQRANLANANFSNSELSNADLWESDLQNVDMSYADLTSSALGWCKVNAAKLEGTKINKLTNLSQASFSKAAVSCLDLSKSPQLKTHIGNIFGDASVVLETGEGPDHPNWPSHWPKRKLGNDFEKEWRNWQADPLKYKPPNVN